MSDKNFKTIRKQLRNVVQEIIGEVLTTELVAAVHKKLSEQVEKRLEGLGAHMKVTLEQIDQRAKDVQAYVVRNTTTPTEAPKEQATPPNTPPPDSL